MCPWQVPWQGLSKCGREGGERLNPHSSTSSHHSWCAYRGCWEGSDPGPRQQGTVTYWLLCCILAAASKILQTTHLTPFTFVLLSHHTCATLNLRQGNAPVPVGSNRILRTPMIPWRMSWLFPTRSTCRLTGMWPHSTPISWVPAFDFHCGLTGLLIMQHNGESSLDLITAGCPTSPRRASSPQIRKQDFQL